VRVQTAWRWQTDTATLAVSNMSERCDARNTSANGTQDVAGLVLCRKTFLWQPAVWASLYASAFATTGPPTLPRAGYYGGETCATFPVPAGYYVHMCKLFDTDECQTFAAGRDTPRSATAGRSICSAHSDCINTRVQQTDSQQKMALPGQGVWPGVGYKCVCRHGFFTEQLHPVVCGGQGIEISFFLTEHMASQALMRPNLSTVLALQRIKMQVVQSLQHTLPEMHRSIPVNMDALESATTLSSTILLCVSNADGVYPTGKAPPELLQLASHARVWQIVIPISTAFIQIVDSTIARSAAVVQATMSAQRLAAANNTLDYEFILYTRKACNVSVPSGHAPVPVLCVVDADCGNPWTHSAKCEASTAYVHSALVHTNSQAQDIVATPIEPAVLRILSVKFDMAALEWQIVLQIDIAQMSGPMLWSSFFLSKTLTKDSKRFFVPTPLSCGTKVLLPHGQHFVYSSILLPHFF